MSNFPTSEEPAEPLAARMLNEFVYCPRLFYYEHVEGVFAHNADTRRGATLHKRVDAGKGALPAPKTTEEAKSPNPEDGAGTDESAVVEKQAQQTIHSRSVSLAS